MGNVRLYGSTSGYTELAPPAVAPDGVLSLPSGTGTLLTAEGGKVLQVVRATDVTQRLTTSTSFVDANISVTITPQKATSAILIIHSAQTNMGAGVRVETQITDSSNIAISGAENTDSAGGRALFTALAWATPATTSATTYKARFRSSNGGSALLENATNTGQMYAIEVSA
jgi:hypothetical protein